MGERRSIARSARLELDEAVAATQRAERKLQQLPLASKGGAAAGVGPRWDERLQAELRAQPALAEALQERLTLTLTLSLTLTLTLTRSTRCSCCTCSITYSCR